MPNQITLYTIKIGFWLSKNYSFEFELFRQNDSKSLNPLRNEPASIRFLPDN